MQVIRLGGWKLRTGNLLPIRETIGSSCWVRFWLSRAHYVLLAILDQSTNAEIPMKTGYRCLLFALKPLRADMKLADI